jgi:LysR family transcriptional regulator, nitrogen assimilation regulatory protein
MLSASAPVAPQGESGTMNIATLLIAHHVLRLRGVRDTARFLDIPPSSVSAAMDRLQAQIATQLVTISGSGIQLTLEGTRLKQQLARAAALIMRIAGLGRAGAGRERRAARLSISILMLQRFVTVSRTGSIRSAAGEIGMGQPQLTRQLKAIEREIGVPLLKRNAHGVVLTKAGLSTLEPAEALQAVWSSMSKHATTRFRKSLTVAKLGSVSPLGHESKIARILAVLAATWRQQTPQSPLYISSTSAEELLVGIQSRAYDVILLDTDTVPRNLTSRVVSRSRLMLVGPAHLMKRAKPAIHHLLLNTPVALPSLKSGLRQKFVALMEDVLSEAERELVSFVEVDSIPVLASLVHEHGFISLLPESALGPFSTPFGRIPLPRSYDLRLTLAWRPLPTSEKVAGIVLGILRDHADIAYNSTKD